MRIVTYDSTHCQVWWSARPIIVNRIRICPEVFITLRVKAFLGFWPLPPFFGNTGHATKKCGVRTIFDQRKLKLVKQKNSRKNKTFQFVSLSRYRVQNVASLNQPL